ncbi:M15 family peptidase, partial [Acinetobacter baumannii]
MMIFLIFFCFACLAIGLAFLMSYELRNKGRTFVLSLLPQGRRQLNQVRQFAQTM